MYGLDEGCFTRVHEWGAFTQVLSSQWCYCSACLRIGILQFQVHIMVSVAYLGVFVKTHRSFHPTACKYFKLQQGSVYKAPPWRENEAIRQSPRVVLAIENGLMGSSLFFYVDLSWTNCSMFFETRLKTATLNCWQVSKALKVPLLQFICACVMLSCVYTCTC